jgi:D-glycero-beta-D-manno-heptose 1-phosphate adenylyltransferase
MIAAGTGPAAFETICARLGVAGDQRVVLGTGCFDIMHIGHLYFLEQAGRHGDVLVIGVNSDQSVRAIKGPSRPIVDQLERATLVAALRCVDHVFVYDDIVADYQIRALRPDVYVIGEESVGRYPGLRQSQVIML